MLIRPFRQAKWCYFGIMRDDGCLPQTITVWMEFGPRGMKHHDLDPQGSMCELRDSLNTLHQSSSNKNVIEQTQPSGILAFLEPIYTLQYPFSLNGAGLMEALASTLSGRCTCEQTKIYMALHKQQYRFIWSPVHNHTSPSPNWGWEPSCIEDPIANILLFCWFAGLIPPRNSSIIRSKRRRFIFISHLQGQQFVFFF